ncbi:MAG TPA: hypothetical protein VL974_14530 [Magnetospirillum sp.]|jgi:hypothetical protein|nr:hypothetical protein [Magnetospirillum sp.]
MLTLLDCVDMCDLGSDIVDAIARHERVPVIVAAELGSCLACCNPGLAVIHRFILDDLEDAAARGDRRDLARYRRALSAFRSAHPGMPPLD